MDYKKKFRDYIKSIKNNFSNKEKMDLMRYVYSKRVFITFGLIFFLNFIFVGARVNDDIFLKTLSYFFYLFIISLSFYVYFLFLKYKVLPENKENILKIVLLIITIILGLTFIGII